MTKIMLVEDDKSLREIYGVRLLAEGYDIVSAGDGEEALAMAIKERPHLILSDVMMPKVSGYDMLDILRSTTETKNIRVIMMTALSSEEQRTRAESLGADRYLVKSQVGIEDVVRVVHEVLEDNLAPEVTSARPIATAPYPTPRPMAATQPAQHPQNPQFAPQPSPMNNLPPRPPSQPVAGTGQHQNLTPSSVTMPRPASIKTRVIQPLGDPSIAPVDINDLLDKELAKEAGISNDARPVVATTDQEKLLIEEQLKAFNDKAPEPTPVVAPPVSQDTQSGPISNMPTPGVFSTGNPTETSMDMPSNIPVFEPVGEPASDAQFTTAPAPVSATPAPAQPSIPATQPHTSIPAPTLNRVPERAPAPAPLAPTTTATVPTMAPTQTVPAPSTAPISGMPPVAPQQPVQTVEPVFSPSLKDDFSDDLSP